MSQLFKLDALVTVLTCLTTTHDELTPIMKNSLQPWQVGNNTDGVDGDGCPVATLSIFTARIQHLAEEVNNMKNDLSQLQDQLSDLQRSGSVNGETRISRHYPSNQPVISHLPRNCVGQKHDAVNIQTSPNDEPFYVFCDQKTHKGGWTVIASRFDGSEDFFRGWQDYKIGFGQVTAEFFIGLDKLHLITHSDNYELLVIMWNKDEERFALYDQFSIGNEREKYLLYVLGSYTGDAGDSLRYHAGKKFTTFDQDNDGNAQNCARTHSGAWWYGPDCFKSNLFGTFQGKFAQMIGNYKGMLWKTFLDGPNGSLRRMRMLVRPRSARS